LYMYYLTTCSSDILVEFGKMVVGLYTHSVDSFNPGGHQKIRTIKILE